MSIATMNPNKTMSSREIEAVAKAIWESAETGDIPDASILENMPFYTRAALAGLRAEILLDKCRSLEKKTETYLVKNLTTGLVKIGKTSQGVEKRVSQFQSMSGGDCEIIHTINRDVEAELHRGFNEKRVIGEWFKLDECDISKIKEIGEES